MCGKKIAPNVLLRKRSVTAKNAQGAKLQESLIEHSLVTDTRREVNRDRQTHDYIQYPHKVMLSSVKHRHADTRPHLCVDALHA